MTRLRDVMATPPITIGPDATVAEAAAAMVKARVGSVLVREHHVDVGILTERDVLRAAGADGDLLATPVRDWMTLDPVTVPADESVDHAVVVMLAGGFRHLPVTESDEVVGVVSIRALLSAGRGGTARYEGDAEEDGSDPAPTASPTAVQQRRSRMFDATRTLQQRSSAAATDPDRWRAGLAEALEELAAVVTRHVAETEGPGGFFEELVRESAGRLSSSVRRLGRDHERSTELIDELRAAVDAGEDPSALRQTADELFAQLEAHRHRGSDLLWRAYAAEIGVGD